ncbi:MAG: H-type lectin domain-containing protein [Polyangiaceae bacterium]|jgi:hypothetical protein
MSYVAPLSLLSAVVVLDASLEGWSLLEPSMQTDRAFRYRVSFSRSFSAPPLVQVGIVGLDASKDDNLRVRVRALDIAEDGFTLLAETWLNTRIWSVDVSWLAVGS